MKLPVVKPKDVAKALSKAGFIKRRQTGSHLILRHPDTKKIVPIPIHAEDIKKGVLKSILKQANLTIEKFLDLL